MSDDTIAPPNMEVWKDGGLTKPLTFQESEALWEQLFLLDDQREEIVLRLYLGRAHLTCLDETGKPAFPNWRSYVKAHIKGRRSYSTIYEDLTAAMLRKGLRLEDYSKDKAVAQPTLADYVAAMPKEHLFSLKALPDPKARNLAVGLAFANAHDEGKEAPSGTLLESAVETVQEFMQTGGAVSIEGDSYPVDVLKAAAEDKYKERLAAHKAKIDEKKQWEWRAFGGQILFLDGFRQHVTFQLDLELYKQLLELYDSKDPDARMSISIQVRRKDDRLP